MVKYSCSSTADPYTNCKNRRKIRSMFQQALLKSLFMQMEDLETTLISQKLYLSYALFEISPGDVALKEEGDNQNKEIEPT